MQVAVVLDESLANVEREKRAVRASEIEEETLRAKQRATGELDPVTKGLTSFQNARDLSARIYKIFDELDADSDGSLSFLKSLKRD